MTDLLMLVGGVIGSITFGLLAAYAMLRTMFRLMRPQQRMAPVKARTEAARV